MIKFRYKEFRRYWWTYCWLWLALYILVWLIFGFIYRDIAIKNSGEDFIFQDDILVKSKNLAFQHDANVKMDYDITKKLIVSYRKDFFLDINSDEISGEFVPIFFNGTQHSIYYTRIGTDWAEYYLKKLELEGYNEYKITILKKSDPIIFDKKYTKVKINFYDIPRDIDVIGATSLPEKYLNKTKEYYIWVDNVILEGDDPLLSIIYGENRYNEISNIKELLSYSINYPEDDIKALRDINTNFKYPIVDFLYFSAITITTLGYGDILPNSSMVRGFVMIETLLGVIFITLFLSSFYDMLKDMKQKKKQLNNNILDLL